LKILVVRSIVLVPIAAIKFVLHGIAVLVPLLQFFQLLIVLKQQILLVPIVIWDRFFLNHTLLKIDQDLSDPFILQMNLDALNCLEVFSPSVFFFHSPFP
jgi:hypothetical protein